MSAPLYSLSSLPTEPLVLILSRLIHIDLTHLRLVCTTLRAQLDRLGARECVVEQRNVGRPSCIFYVMCWPQMGIERLDIIEQSGLSCSVVTNYTSCMPRMVMSILNYPHHRYLYIINGAAKYMLFITRSDKHSGAVIVSPGRPLRVQEYLDEWMKHRTGCYSQLRSTASDSNMLQVVLDIWDTHYGGLQHIFAPEVVQLLTSFTA